MAEQPLQYMELHENEDDKDQKNIEKLIKNRLKNTRCLWNSTIKAVFTIL